MGIFGNVPGPWKMSTLYLHIKTNPVDLTIKEWETEISLVPRSRRYAEPRKSLVLPLVRDFLNGLFLCRSHIFCFRIAPSKLFHLSMKNHVWKQRGKSKRRPAVCNFHQFFLARGIPMLERTETWTLPNARYEKLGLIVCLEYIGGIIKETGEVYELKTVMWMKPSHF